MNQQEIELLKKFMEEKQIPKAAENEGTKTMKTEEGFISTDFDPNLIVPPLGTYECYRAECSNSARGAWD